jgi:hypothetical protein
LELEEVEESVPLSGGAVNDAGGGGGGGGGGGFGTGQPSLPMAPRRTSSRCQVKSHRTRISSGADLTVFGAREGRVVEYIGCARVALAMKRFALFLHAGPFPATIHD